MAFEISRILLLATLFPPFTLLVSGAAIPNNSTLTKRAYSVPATPDRQDGLGPWPRRRTPQQPQGSPIWYCFKDQESAMALHDLTLAGIAKWRQALEPHTSLRIELHPSTKGNPFRTCGPPVDPKDILVISYDGENGDPSTTIGYDYKSNESGRHWLKFAGYSTAEIRNDPWPAVLSMAHELGHAIGLAHEHQRSDISPNIQFKCTNLQGWFKTEQKVRAALNTRDARIVREEMEKICTKPDLAEQYGFHEIRDYTTGDNIGPPFRSMTQDAVVDRNSIMIYGSWQGSEEQPSDDLGDAVLTYQNDDCEEFEIFQGGNPDPRLAGPSAQDIARVRQLYPRI